MSADARQHYLMVSWLYITYFLCWQNICERNVWKNGKHCLWPDARIRQTMLTRNPDSSCDAQMEGFAHVVSIRSLSQFLLRQFLVLCMCFLLTLFCKCANPPRNPEPGSVSDWAWCSMYRVNQGVALSELNWRRLWQLWLFYLFMCLENIPSFKGFA